MICEICGTEIKGRPHYIKVDGATLMVCSSCAKYGEKVEKAPPKTTKALVSKNVSLRAHKTRTNKIRTRDYEQEYLIVPDFGERIKEARLKLGLTLEKVAKKIKEKESWLRKIEQGKIQPPLDTARKLERYLGIKLVEKSYEEEPTVVDRPKELTFGDIVDFKKKRR